VQDNLYMRCQHEAMRTLVFSAISVAALSSAAEIPVTDHSRLELQNAKIENATHHGKSALRVVEDKAPPDGPGEAAAILKNMVFHNGTIELDVSGAPGARPEEGARGFIGVAFRIQQNGACENIYIRPTNGRVDDQERRNHAVQYVSPPEWGWRKLREQFPSKYESYADMQGGEWVHMKIVVNGKSAKTYIGNVAQPTLIVSEMLHGDTTGGVALWVGPGTEAFFRNLRIASE